MECPDFFISNYKEKVRVCYFVWKMYHKAVRRPEKCDLGNFGKIQEFSKNFQNWPIFLINHKNWQC